MTTARLPGRRNRRNKWFVPAVPRNRKIPEFRSERFSGREKMLGIQYPGTNLEANFRNFVPNHSAEEKTTQNSIPWNKNGGNFRIFFLKHFTEESVLSILSARTGNFRFEFLKLQRPKISKIVSEKTTFEVQTNHLVKLLWLFCKNNICRIIPFRFELPNWPFHGLRNEHFIPRDNGNRSQSIPWIFSERISVPQPYLLHAERYLQTVKTGWIKTFL